MGKAITGLFFAIALQACQPSEASYEDCVLNRMDGAASDTAAKVIVMACRERYPAEENPFAKYHQ